MLLIRIIKNIFRFLFNCLVVLEKVSEAAEKKTSEWVVKQEQEQLSKNSREKEISSRLLELQRKADQQFEQSKKEWNLGLEDISSKNETVTFDLEPDGFMTREHLINALINMGFEAHITRSSTWKSAFILSNIDHTLYILFGKQSIGFKYYDYIRVPNIDEKGKLATDGGRMTWNFYNESKINLHSFTYDLARRFSENQALTEEDLMGKGFSPKIKKPT
ncbi:hypothetical protein MT367_23165 [Vibrio parahaemolyticus]|nr:MULTISPECIES: hypothetical protein [Vibrio]MDL2018648.1 hypothetical protein [Vibrio parahaemolyticus]MDL2040733.1 hypothetical protein [Vibrio parahaemolyticus]NVC63407.1 hypothetical protein [Vibrio sp. 05-20-BW147]